MKLFSLSVGRYPVDALSVIQVIWCKLTMQPCPVDALEMVGMSGFAERPYTQLSSGEGQLVMVARARAQNTPLIIMD